MTALGQQLAGDMKADKTRRTRDQYCLIRHRIPKGRWFRSHHRPGLFYPPY